MTVVRAAPGRSSASPRSIRTVPDAGVARHAGRIPIAIHTADPISRVGIATQLRAHPSLWLLDDGESAEARVSLVIADEVDDEAIQLVRSLALHTATVVIARDIDDTALTRIVEAGARGILRRSEAVPERLVAALLAAANGEGAVPPDLLGRLLAHVGTLQREILAPRGLGMLRLTERETTVMRLVADGLDTGEIAARLAYSERTVKNVIHDVVARHQLRNRTHAVAFAIRQGWI
jgi:DNA-binding NarL/FixJ family response regulator